MKKIVNNLKSTRLLRLTVFLIGIFLVNTNFPMIQSKSQREIGKKAAGGIIREMREQAQRQTEKQQQLIMAELSNKRGLLMFLDNTEINELGAIGYTLCLALCQEAGPIIVTNSLLCTLLELRAGNNPSYAKIDIKISHLCFEPERWIIKKINNMNLLIPQKHLEIFNIDREMVEKYNVNIDVISDEELKLGLKVNHMETVYAKQINRTNSPIYFADSLHSIFCKNTDYKNRSMNIPGWFIYVQGHGMTNSGIVGISLDNFQKCLTFLESSISTQLLIISSCYAAGVNSQNMYGDMKLGTQKYYSFPIIIQGLNDIQGMSRSPYLDIMISKKSAEEREQFKLETDFVSFFKNIMSLEGNYGEIVRPIVTEYRSNIPQIKMPGMEWFSIMEINKKIVSIGSILTKTRDPQKPLDIVTYFKKDPEVILLYTDDIPFELKINSDKVGAMVSMISSGPIKDKPEFVIHTIKKISSSQRFLSIVRWFRLVVESNISKWFFINEIEDNKNIIVFGTGRDTARIYYTNKYGFPYKAELKRDEYGITFEAIERDSEDENDYREKLLMKSKYVGYSEAEKKEKEITSQEIKNIEDVLSRREEIRKREEQKRSELGQ